DDDNSDADSRNAWLQFMVTETGTYTVQVSATTGSGDYTLTVEGASGQQAPFTVTAAVPENNAGIQNYPGTYRITLSEQVLLTSLSADDLTVNGVAATAVTVIDGNTLEFDISSADIGPDQVYTVSIAAGALQSVSGAGLEEYNAFFTTDQTPPVVNSISVGDWSVQTTDPLTISVTFSEPMDPVGLGVEDVTLTDDLGNSYNATNLIYDANTNSAQISFPSLPEGAYIWSLLSNPTAFRDRAGLLLDGDGWGGPGGNFSSAFYVDADTQAYPVPLTAILPDGSLIYNSLVNGQFHEQGDEDTYTLEIEAGQVLTVILASDNPSLTGEIELFDPNASSLGVITASANGADAVLQTIAITETGAYSIVVRSASGDGRYRLQALLNAAKEVEVSDQNDWSAILATAQDIDLSFIDLGHGASRGAAIGQINSPYSDPPVLFATIRASNSSDPSTLVELNPATGSIIRTIGAIGYAVNGLEYNPTRGILYGTVSSNDPSAANSLIAIDMATGAGSIIGNPGVDTLVNLTCDSSGRLFAWSQDNSALFELDPDTGNGTLLNSTDIWPNTHGLAADANNNLYLVNGGGDVYLIDSQDGSSNYLFNIGQTAHHGDFDPDSGYYFGISDTSSSASLVVVDMASQSVIASHNTGIAIHTLSFKPGVLDTAPQDLADWYSVSLPGGQSSTITLSRNDRTLPGSVELELYNATGDLLATGSTDSTTLDRYISNFTPIADATFYLKVSGDPTGYSLVITRGADFDLELPAIQDISITDTVLGFVGGGAGTGDLGSGPSGSTGLGINLYDASGYRWDIQRNGNISDGTSDAYDGG
ncbi:MAG: Ig-like domain-containing protein, partial [Desulfobulbaceae bacterium]|nr:Ig-like domain-containing protein [Desulfobulbaceae bacterium]